MTILLGSSAIGIAGLASKISTICYVKSLDPSPRFTSPPVLSSDRIVVVKSKEQPNAGEESGAPETTISDKSRLLKIAVATDQENWSGLLF